MLPPEEAFTNLPVYLVFTPSITLSALPNVYVLILTKWSEPFREEDW